MVHRESFVHLFANFLFEAYRNETLFHVNCCVCNQSLEKKRELLPTGECECPGTAANEYCLYGQALRTPA